MSSFRSVHVTTMYVHVQKKYLNVESNLEGSRLIKLINWEIEKEEENSKANL